MIALIDADSLIYAAAHKRTPDEAVLYLTGRIDDILEATESNEYALFLTIGRTFRHNKTEGYKKSRPKQRKEPVFYYIQEYMRTQLNAIFQRELEADDLVTYWNNKIEDSIVCSPDKDVINTNDRCYNYNKNELVEKSIEEINTFFWKQMLMGDSTDSIQGIPGCGDKTSSKLIEELELDRIKGRAIVTNEQMVLSKYIEQFGMSNGIEMFYKNYKQLYILRTNEDFEINQLEIPEQLNTVKRNEEI